MSARKQNRRHGSFVWNNFDTGSDEHFSLCKDSFALGGERLSLWRLINISNSQLLLLFRTIVRTTHYAQRIGSWDQFWRVSKLNPDSSKRTLTLVGEQRLVDDRWHRCGSRRQQHNTKVSRDLAFVFKYTYRNKTYCQNSVKSYTVFITQ